MKLKIPRLLVSAPSSHSGKTVVTCGLLQALKNRNITCSSFKCGPDYIDPMFHRYVLGTKGGNLDSYFLQKNELLRNLICLSRETELSVIEGVMGYYDGIGGISTAASSYEIASITNTPVLLVIDAKGASLSIAAVVKGFIDYKRDSNIAGIILNRTTKAMAERLRPVIEELSVPLLGWIPECEAARLESRHLGLVLPEELKNLQTQILELAAQMEHTIDLDRLISIAGSAKEIEWEEELFEPEKEKQKESVKIGIAMDEAFCFYYEENLRLMEQMGVEFIRFSPIHDSKIPDGINGFLLGGGYPENYARELSENISMLKSVKNAIQKGMPALAECGGFLYLHETLEGIGKKDYAMVGVIPEKAYRTNRLSRFGYLSLEPKQDMLCLKQGEQIKGHEFHYWDSTNPGTRCMAKKPLSNRTWECIWQTDTLMAGFAHLYYPSNPEFIRRWVTLCRNQKEG